MSATSLGRVDWELNQDDEGNRTYTLRSLIKTSGSTVGPMSVMSATGLPTIGSPWSYGTDSDPWAYCSPMVRVTPVIKKKPNKFWIVENKFTTLPFKRCSSNTIQNPISEPPDISGSFVKYTEESSKDKDGSIITYSNHEPIRGSQAEWDAGRATVSISLNTLSLQLDFFASLIHNCNDSLMWGLPAGCVKLSNISWGRKIYGTCSYYYTRKFDFDISYNGFGRDIVDQGSKVLDGQWVNRHWVTNPSLPPDAELDPKNFVRYKDLNGENTTILLDGHGEPLDIFGTGSNPTEPQSFYLDHYPRSNLLLLGIPSSL